MKTKATFYHAGCPVCIDAEDKIIKAIDQTQYDVEIVHFAKHPDRINEAESLGVRSVPALILRDEVFHINFGASLMDVKASQ